KEMRGVVSVPLVYLLYYNCILQYGTEKFFTDCAESGIDGLIIPDLPYEERDEIEEVASRYPVDLITLVAPTSKDRIEQVVKNARGFLYCVSSLGVTGVRSNFDTNFEEFFSDINKYAPIPTAIGFGISTPDHVRQLKHYSDGLIVGSAIVRQVERSANKDEAVLNVGSFVRSLREAMDE
ncbi:MAG: tryptophan synthase subunit alpha, partial [Clostridia bacterium]|nr:tryptophan synthase subunit alpha [Clostridia bacterium]